jgi:hypothetical protein
MGRQARLNGTRDLRDAKVGQSLTCARLQAYLSLGQAAGHVAVPVARCCLFAMTCQVDAAGREVRRRIFSFVAVSWQNRRLTGQMEDL